MPVYLPRKIYFLSLKSQVHADSDDCRRRKILNSDLAVMCCEFNAYGSLLLFEVGGWLSAWQGQKANTYVEELLYNASDERER
jgi:hypothetical protein